ncbi:hypothetical protein C3H94_05375 [Campylobacter jejuni]|nr:hypothetical protein C3I16_06100 [Campylobacter jejuni]RTJ07598.1 hypothetical protein C3H94_05375 [Campylobacter jejuni]RTJ18069.1 hypothetical protein C3H87_05650 [Campylobacter jejuni]RTJ44703.1 hypothetical protein C3H74_05675 [Campylobacter jejuni]
MNISSNKLKNIGKKIKKNEELTNEEQDLFSYWLNLHFDIMKKMHRHVVDKLKKLGIKNYIIAKRTKRLESISFKLKRYPNFALDRIQDIAGMRIICDNLKDVNSIKDELKKHYQKNISVFKYSNMDDYINEPKNDGYRSYHLIFIDIKTKCKVEIQIRTKLQHSWATAVEIIDMDPYCKIKQGTGKSVYKDFFKLSSALFSRIEGTKIVEPYQNYNIEKIYYFLKILDMRSNILEKLKNSNINENITQDHKDKFYFVVYLDRNKRTNVASYSKDDLNKARKDYNNLEKNKDINVVLISLDSQKKIRKAYPNYYLDGNLFIDNIKKYNNIKYFFLKRMIYYISFKIYFKNKNHFDRQEIKNISILYQDIFNQKMDKIDTELNLNFEDLQEKIKQECINYNKNEKESHKKSLSKTANDFRVFFKKIKNILLKDNNPFDALDFSKLELYCKEIELKEDWCDKIKNFKTNKNKNNNNNFELINFLLLGFYRKLSDHHTDLLKAINNLILLIALHALFIFGFTWLHDDKLEDTRAILTLFGFFDKFRLYFDIISTIFVVFGCGFFVWKLNSYEKKNNVSKKQNINFIYIIGDFLNLIKSLFFASFIPCVFYVLFSLFGFFLNLGKDFGYSLLINTLFVSLYICLVYTKSLFFGRYVVLIFSYIGFIIMLIKQPNVILPLIGKIANESDKFFNYPSLIVLNILYTILLVLVLFSLQKTARKNSIVPS